MAFGPWLKAEREKRGWSQDQLADCVGMTKATISRFETGQRKPLRDRVERIASSLEADVNGALIAAGFVPTDTSAGASANDFEKKTIRLDTGDTIVVYGEEVKITEETLQLLKVWASAVRRGGEN